LRMRELRCKERFIRSRKKRRGIKRRETRIATKDRKWMMALVHQPMYQSSHILNHLIGIRKKLVLSQKRQSKLNKEYQLNGILH
jgi:hypothetical protein